MPVFIITSLFNWTNFCPIVPIEFKLDFLHHFKCYTKLLHCTESWIQPLSWLKKSSFWTVNYNNASNMSKEWCFYLFVCLHVCLLIGWLIDWLQLHWQNFIWIKKIPFMSHRKRLSLEKYSEIQTEWIRPACVISATVFNTINSMQLQW